jgi:hypothetical protein
LIIYKTAGEADRCAPFLSIETAPLAANFAALCSNAFPDLPKLGSMFDSILVGKFNPNIRVNFAHALSHTRVCRNNQLTRNRSRSTQIQPALVSGKPGAIQIP